MTPIFTHNSFSILDDEAMDKLATALNKTETTVAITKSYDEAQKIVQANKAEGHQVRLNNYGGSFHINVIPREEIELTAALESGQFQKFTSDRYTFTKQANNPLGIQHYSFDEGTIWKVMKGKDGKDYLVKEVDDKDTDKVIRSTDNKMTKATVLASSNINPSQLKHLANVLYNNPSEELINDLINISADSLSRVLTAKLNNIINSELDAMNITSPYFKEQAREKVAYVIKSNAIYDRNQITKIIADSNKIDLNSLNK